jgi:hypothetical protein
VLLCHDVRSSGLPGGTPEPLNITWYQRRRAVPYTLFSAPGPLIRKDTLPGMASMFKLSPDCIPRAATETNGLGQKHVLNYHRLRAT